MTKKEKKARQERIEDLMFKYQVVSDFIKTLGKFCVDAPTLSDATVEVEVVKIAIEDLGNLKGLILLPFGSR